MFTSYLKNIPEENINNFKYLWKHVWGLDVDRAKDVVTIKTLIHKSTVLEENEKTKIMEAPFFQGHLIPEGFRLRKLLYYININSQSST